MLEIHKSENWKNYEVVQTLGDSHTRIYLNGVEVHTVASVTCKARHTALLWVRNQVPEDQKNMWVYRKAQGGQNVPIF